MNIYSLTILLLAIGSLINVFNLMNVKKRLDLLEVKLDEVEK